MKVSRIAQMSFIGLAVLTAGCHHRGGGDRHAMEARTDGEARTLVAAVAAAYNAHDAAKAASYDAPNYVSMFHGFQTAVGPEADIASMKQQFLDPAAKFDLDIEDVDVSRGGDMAVVRSTYVFTSTDPKTKKIVSESGNWVAGLERQPDHSLKLAWSIGADTPAATPAPPPTPTS